MDAAVKIQIDLHEEELEGLAEVAKRRGHKSIAEYIRYLVNEDADKHDEASPVDDDEMHILESFRRAWEDVKAGRVMSHEEFLQRMQEDND